ncbi:MAG: HAMP domain-containing protein, partial [Anaerolineales bacterium]
QAEPPVGLIDQLAELYAQHEDWTGAEDVFVGIATETPDQIKTPPVVLVDTQGKYVASNWMQRLDGRVLDADLADGWPVRVNGETVGTLILPGFPRPPEDVIREGFSPEGAATVGRVRDAIFVAGLSAGALGLAIAGLLAWGLVRPLRRLRVAAEGIAQGDLCQRVPVSSHDE